MRLCARGLLASNNAAYRVASARVGAVTIAAAASLRTACRCHSSSSNGNNNNNDDDNEDGTMHGGDGARQRTSDALRRLFRDDVTRAAAAQQRQPPAYAQTAHTRTVSLAADVDDDVDDASKGNGNDGNEVIAKSEAATRTAPAHSVELLEQELLDDNFAYFPLALANNNSGSSGVIDDEFADDDAEAGDGSAAAAAAADAAASTATQRYVPGQQIVPPGMTRYRVDVQYQGCDFDGWHASTSRVLYHRYVGADGRVRRVVAPTSSSSTAAAATASAGAVVRDGAAATTRYFAQSVLEDALAVALDVSSVKVVASVMPEMGVTVRRLCCHVDVPSDIEMQPRTVVQRATLWLQKRQQPLAILAFTRCRNQDWHARHSGVRRVYCYRICNRVAPPLFDAGMQWHVDRYLDVARMQRFAAAMEGTRDYGYFADPKMANALRRAAAHTATGRTSSAYSEEHYTPTSLGLSAGQAPAAPKLPYEKGLSNLQRAAALPTFNEYGQRVLSYNAKSSQYYRAATNLPTVRTVDKIDVVRQDDEVLLWFVGQSFLRHQIRNMVAVLKASGHGLWDEQELRHAFATGFTTSRKRFAREHLPPAPAHGLTLWDVEYPAAHRDDYVAFVDSGPYEEVDVTATL